MANTKDSKTIIVILISIVVVIIAFYIRVSPEPAAAPTESTNATTTALEDSENSGDVTGGSGASSDSMPSQVPPAPGNTVTPPSNLGTPSGPQ